MDATTTIAAVTSAVSDIGLIVAAVVGLVLVIWAALVGLGFGKRKVQKHITGEKW